MHISFVSKFKVKTAFSNFSHRLFQVLDAETKQDLPDVLERVKFSCFSWTHDHKGFFYNVGELVFFSMK
jgi:Prolyl oligopeptidase, N-terminal beta-propeller domain